MAGIKKVFNCPLCPDFRATKFQLLLPHLRLVHSTRPGFSVTCNIEGCSRSFTNMKTYTNHLYGDHPNLPEAADEVSGPEFLQHSCNQTNCNDVYHEDENIDDEINDDSGNDSSNATSMPTLDDHIRCFKSEILSLTACWILQIKECYKLTQSTTEEIIRKVTDLHQFIMSKVLLATSVALQNAGIDINDIPRLVDIFSPNGGFGKPFEGIETSHRLLQHCKRDLKFVEPVSVVLGTTNKWKGYGLKRAYKCVEETMMYIPIIQTLASLFEDKSLTDEIRRGHPSENGIIGDFCDGQFFKRSSFFKKKQLNLQINFYYDDVEVCNPLGSKRKVHKLGFFYFQLSNLPPSMRSKINGIQLLAIAKKKLINKYSMASVLKPIVDDLKKLEGGVDLIFDGALSTVYGTIATVIADNLGSCALGGFKEGSLAYRFCRQCLITCDDRRRVCHEDQCTLRTVDEHNEQCAEVAIDSSKSREYGINATSPLNELKYFHTCTGALVPDIMHDVLEGGLQYEAKLMLKKFIQVDKYFCLDDLNYKIENFEFNSTDVKNRPTPITVTTLSSNDNLLKQNASQMWLLARSLPLIIGPCVPHDDANWKNFCLFLNITRILFAPRLNEDDLAVLQQDISTHHQEFVSLYPNDSLIPKMHYLIHMPRLIYEFGPLVHLWTMRFEAKHKYFKSLANSIGNFINIPYTLAKRHQFLQCYLRLRQSDPTSIPEFTNGVDMTTSELPYLNELIQSGSHVYSTGSVKINNITYKKSAVVATKVAEEFDHPSFGKIEEIYVKDSSVYLYVNDFHTIDYDEHYCAYNTKPSQNYSFIKFERATPLDSSTTRIQYSK